MLAETASTGTRLDILRAARDDLAARMDVCSSDQNYATLGRLLTDVLAQIDELDGDEKPKETGLSEFERRLRERTAEKEQRL